MVTAVVSRYTWYIILYARQVYISILLFYSMKVFTSGEIYVKNEKGRDRERDTNTDKRFKKNKTKIG